MFSKTTVSPNSTTKPVFHLVVKNHILLFGEIEELLYNMEKLCFTYQHVDCLYTLLKYRFSGKKIAKSGNVFDKMQRAIFFNQKTEEWTKCRVLQKRSF